MAKREKTKEFYRLLLKGHVVGYAKKMGSGLLFSEDGEVWSDMKIKYDDAVKLYRPPGCHIADAVVNSEDVTKIYKVNFRIRQEGNY